ncbi:MAG TPA: ABC transporter permease [Thermoanaerobacterales bacterium]|jgi:ABC-2 type transport system permease protein|nr:ABC transporter permease [Thermoanaerobacterales bacterium]
MQVYKAFFKIIQKNLAQLVIYVVVFLVFAILIANTYENPVNTDFAETKVNIAFLNHDADSMLIEDFKEYISQYANLAITQDDPQKLQDALYFRTVEYIVRIGEGFTENFLNGKEVQIEKAVVAGSTSGVYMDGLINKYFNTANTYVENIADLSVQELVQYVRRDLAQKAEVVLLPGTQNKNMDELAGYYFNFIAYSLMAILILGVSAVMIVFNQDDLKRRSLCSPVKIENINFQMILGTLSFAVLSWLVLMVASFIMYKDYMFQESGLLYILNSFVFILPALSISYLIGNTVKSKDAMSAVANVVSLGSCFISGVFVPQEILGDTVLKIASFTPTYWYIKNNNEISRLVSFEFENLTGIFNNMLIMAGFAAAFFAITSVVMKQKRMSV